MRLLGNLLTVAVLTGLLASVQSDERKSPFSHLKESIRGYVETVEHGTEEMWYWVLSLNSSKELRTQISDDLSKAGRYLEKLHEELPTETRGVLDLVSNKCDNAFRSLMFGFVPLFADIDSMMEKLNSALEPILEPYADAVEGLSARIQEMSNRKAEDMAKQLEQLQTKETQLSSNIKKIQAHLQEFQKSVEPFADMFQQRFQQRMETLNYYLKPYLVPIQEALERLMHE